MSVSFTSDSVILPGGTQSGTSDRGKLITIDTYSSPGTYTWTKPEQCNKVLVKVTGGGGGGTGYCESGGAGGYAEKVIDVSGISSVSITVGAGGGNVGYSGGGGDGGTSSFGAYATASGGYGCNRNVAHTGGHGGVGSGGDINLTGGAGTGHSNGAGRGALGQGGNSFWGTGTKVSHNSDLGGIGNSAPGAGGPGAATDISWTGGPGFGGIVVVYSYG